METLGILGIIIMTQHHGPLFSSQRFCYMTVADLLSCLWLRCVLGGRQGYKLRRQEVPIASSAEWLQDQVPDALTDMG